MPWLPVMLRGTRVFARCNEAGVLASEDGRVEIRYRAGDGKAYRALAINLGHVADGKVLPDGHCGDAQPVAKKSEGDKPAAGGAAPARARSMPTKKAAGPVVSAPEGTIVAYTDGACSGNPGPAGLGVVLLDDGQCTELSEYLGVGTNNIAELTAILRALERYGASEREIWVHTDSQYAIGVLTKGWKAKANTELIAFTRQIMRKFSALKLVYVPGHAGVPLNERADELARAAVSARQSAGWVARK